MTIEMSPRDTHLIVVVGMHRSGTSAVTRALQVFGVDLGDNLMPASPFHNEKGFWEDEDIVDFDETLLSHLGREWHTEEPISEVDLERLSRGGWSKRAKALLHAKLAGVRHFGIKDPRMARLLGFWMPVFTIATRISYVVVVRNPMSVARSLATRNHFDAKKSHGLWLAHQRDILSALRGESPLVIDYDHLMERSDIELRRIARHLGFDYAAHGKGAAEYSQEFLDERLRHSRYEEGQLLLARHAPYELLETYSMMLRAAEDRLDFGALKFDGFRRGGS